jgi:hypothetical protein
VSSLAELSQLVETPIEVEAYLRVDLCVRHLLVDRIRKTR